MFAPGFITDAGDRYLQRYPVYVRAIDRRLDAIDKSPEGDRRKRAEFLPLQATFNNLPEQVDPLGRNAARWRLEELRVSLFAQSLGTREKVSVKRVESELQRLLSD